MRTIHYCSKAKKIIFAAVVLWAAIPNLALSQVCWAYIRGNYQTFTSLSSAISAASGSLIDINMMQNVNVSTLTISSRSIRFVLNGYSITVDGTSPYLTGLVSVTNSDVYLDNSSGGEFNIVAKGEYALEVTNSYVEVSNVSLSYSTSLDQGYCIFASGYDTEVKVLGSVTSTGTWITGGVRAANGAKIEIGFRLYASTSRYIQLDNSPNKGLNDFTLPTTQAGYLTYTNGTSTVYRVGSPGRCRIVSTGVEYNNVQDAVWDIASSGTIMLLENINYNSPLTIDEKRITFNLNGYNLNVNAGYHESYSGAGVIVGTYNYGELNLTGSGEFNCSGPDYGLALTAGSKATVTNVKATGGGESNLIRGIYATTGSEVTVRGNVDVTSTWGTRIGVHARRNSNVSVDGTITVSGTYVRFTDVNNTDVNKGISDITLPTTKSGYNTYTHTFAEGTNNVWVKINTVPVTSITGVPTTATAGIALTLSGTVNPSGATNKTITWSVTNAGATGATISGSTFNATAAGTATVRATIANGLSTGVDYTQDFNITVSRATLGGSVTISGSPVFGQSLSAVTSSLTSTPSVTLGTLTYQWKRGSTNIGTNSASYTLVQDDIGNTITVTVSAANCSGSVSSSATATVTKANTQTAPSAPTKSGSTSTSITLTTMTGCEYDMNNGTWQTSSTFNGLTPNTSYSFRARRAETATLLASSASSTASISTDKAMLSGTVTITGSAVFGQILTANTSLLTSTPSVTLGALSYQWRRGTNNISGATGSTYTLASDDIGSTLNVVITAANCDGSITSGSTATVGKATQTAPSAPTLSGATVTSITLNSIAGCEYSRTNGVTWQTSNTFSDLTPNTSYSFTARYASTTTHSESSASPSVSFSTFKATLTGTVVISSIAVFEQTLNAVTTGLSTLPEGQPLGALNYQWRRGTTDIVGATGLSYTLAPADIGNTISVVVTAANCEGSVTSNSTSAVSKATQSAPDAPTMASSTTTSITLNSITGCEYNRDNGAWQTSPAFSGLTPGISYNFRARKAETNTHLASQESAVASFMADIVPVTGITGVPATVIAGVDLSLSGVTVNPAGATYKTIVWSIFNAGSTDASIINDNILRTTAAGEVSITATIIHGTAAGTDYTQNFNISVITTPSAPGNFTATPGNGQVILAWTMADNGGSAITKYEVSSDNGGSWVTASDNAGHTFTGLANGTQYTFRVRAVNIAGNGTEATITATPRTGASAPQNFTAVAGNGQVTLSWAIPADDGGNTITEYQVSNDNGDHWVTASGNTGHTFSGLANGTQYTFKVRAVNTAGPGAEAVATATPINPVVRITDVPVATTAGVDLSFDGATVEPAGATFKNIVWSIASAGSTGASIINGNKLRTTAAGEAVITATIVNGTALDVSYTQSFTITVHTAVLEGTVTIEGNAIFGQTITAVTSGLTSTVQLGALTCQWKRGGENTGVNSDTYTLTQADIGSMITVTVTAANCTGSITSSATATVVKASQEAPAAPAFASGSATAITLHSIEGCEYMRNGVGGGIWQDSPTFGELLTNIPYTFTARRKETPTHFASPESLPTTFSTGMATLSGSVTIDGLAAFGSVLTANISALTSNPAVSLGNLTYQWKRGGENIGDNSDTYILTQADIGNMITVTVTAAQCNGSIKSMETAVITKAVQEAPDSPLLSGKTTVSITLYAMAGCEYSIYGGAWQKSPVFDGLTPSTSYIFTARRVETDTHFPSSASTPAAFATDGALCKIVETGTSFASFDGALAAVIGGQTIRLLENVNHIGQATITGKRITFDLNGFTLNWSATTNVAPYATLTVGNGGEILLINANDGAFNVTGLYRAIEATGGGKVTVTNATATGYQSGLSAVSSNGQGSEVYVQGAIVHHAQLIPVACGSKNFSFDFGWASNTKPGYIEYSDGAAYVWVKEDPEIFYPCFIVQTAVMYMSIAGAMAEVDDGYTIMLLEDTNYHKGIALANKRFILDLNGKKLNVSNESVDGIGLDINNVEILLTNPDNGEFNVSGVNIGLRSTGNSRITVTSATATGNYPEEETEKGIGVDADDSEVTVLRNVKIMSGSGLMIRNCAKIKILGELIVPERATYIRKITAFSSLTTSISKEMGTLSLRRAGYLRFTLDECDDVEVQNKQSFVIAETGKTYQGLAETVAAVESGQTIRLLEDYEYAGSLPIAGKNFVFDLNGKKLNITAEDETALLLTNSNIGLLKATNGEWNVASEKQGISVLSGGKIALTSVTASHSTGIFANGQGAEAVVFGDVTVNGSGVGIHVTNGARATVNGVMNIPVSAIYVMVGTTEKMKHQNQEISTKAGYFEYTDGLNYVWVKNPDYQFPCKIAETDVHFATLEQALQAVQNRQTIMLLRSFDYYSDMDITGKSVTIDLNGKILTVRSDVTIRNGGELRLLNPTNGQLIVYSENFSVSGGGKAEVTSVFSDHGVVADGLGSELTVFGDITASVLGALVTNKATIVINGAIVAMAGEYLDEYIRVGSIEKRQEYGKVSRTKTGYLEYSDGENYVWVKSHQLKHWFEIEDTNLKYALLDEVMDAVLPGEKIRAIDDFNQPVGIVINNKIFTFDLNQKIIHVNDPSAAGVGLRVLNGGALNAANGEFNFTGVSVGVWVESGAKATITNAAATGENAIGVYAKGYDTEVNVTGDVRFNSKGIGVWVDHGARVIVNGEIHAPDGANIIRIGDQFKTMLHGLPSSIMPGYLEFTDGISVVWLKIGSLDAWYTCKIVETGQNFFSLDAALDEALNGQTIRLLQDIDHKTKIYLYAKTITFDLNGMKLNVSGDDYGIDSWAYGEIRLLDPAHGELNVAGRTAAMYAQSGKFTVTSATATGNAQGIQAMYGAEVTVIGDVQTGANFGVSVTKGAKVTINGAITAPDRAYISIEGAVKTKAEGTPSEIMPGYLEYTDGTSYVWVKNPKPDPQVFAFLCKIVETDIHYVSLTDALAAVQNYQTIKILENIDHNGEIRLDGKIVIFDLNGLMLNITDGLYIVNGGEVRLLDPTNGEFNVTGSNYGVFTKDGGKASVTNVTVFDGHSVYATNGSEVTVYNDVTVAHGNGYGLYVGENSKVIVNGTLSVPDEATDIFVGSNQILTEGIPSVVLPGYFEYTDQTSYAWVKLFFVPVKGISGVPAAATAGTPLTLVHKIAPANATDQYVVWRVKDAGDTKASITNGILTATAAGVATITAIILDGEASGIPYMQDFKITVNTAFVEVTGVMGIPEKGMAGMPLSLEAFVIPENATNQAIAWSLRTEDAIGITIDDHILNVAKGGTVTITVTIEDGIAMGIPYIQDFNITIDTPFVPVTGVADVPVAATAGVPLTIAASIVPNDATNQTIVWTVKEAGGTGVVVNDDVLTATSAGTVIMTAAIANGLAEEFAYTQDFIITVNETFVAVTDITDVPDMASSGMPLELGNSIVPPNAANQSVQWSVKDAGDTDVSIEGNILNANTGGTVTIVATIDNGTDTDIPFTKEFIITIQVPFVPVTDIADVPAAATAGTPLTLTSSVVPANATHPKIVWTVKEANGTVATINNNIFSATLPGAVKIIATIDDGIAAGVAYTREFDVTVNEAFVMVRSISGVPLMATAGIPLTLAGNAKPANATYQLIKWTVKDAGASGATIHGNLLNATAAGIATVTATITDGKASGANFTQDFTISINAPSLEVRNIAGVARATTLDVPLILTGTVEPSNAANRNITWSVKDAGTTGATVNGAIFNSTAEGTAIVTATIANGKAADVDYTQDFFITVNKILMPIRGITGVPDAATVGRPITLAGKIAPLIATRQNIIWSVKSAGGTGAVINGTTLSVTSTGKMTVTATIDDGIAEGVAYTQDFDITVNSQYMSVTGITGVPLTAVAGTPLPLRGSIAPTNANHTAIAWNIKNAGTTGATINSNELNTTAAGIVTIAAFINDGTSTDIPFTQEFNIIVNETFVAVRNISAVPKAATVKTPMALTVSITPQIATNQSIVWSVKEAGATGATINGAILSANATGKMKITATIANGRALNDPYTQDFDIIVNPEFVAVNSIKDVPDTGIAQSSLTLEGTVAPANATSQNIKWSVKDAGATGASINNEMFMPNAGGAAKITATIPNGLASGTPYTQDFDILVDAPFMAVRGITGVPGSVTAGTPVSLLNAKVTPLVATNQRIVWSVKDAGATGAAIYGTLLYTTVPGTVKISATIADGIAKGTSYTQEFTIIVNSTFVAVTSISNVPLTASTGTPTPLEATVAPAHATYQTIAWNVKSAGTTGATISDNTLHTNAAGTAIVTATITNGRAVGTSFTQDFTITVTTPFVPVTDINNVPLTVTAGTPLVLDGSITPANATHQTIVWSVQDAGTTGAAITGNTLKTTASGTATVTATIADGLAEGTTYTKNFTITVNAPFVPVSGILYVTSTAIAGTPSMLSGFITPENATYQTIVWSVREAGTTGAAITGAVFNASSAGTATVTATIANGLSAGTAYTQDFTITVNAVFVAVTDIANVPLTATAKTPLMLSGSVAPANATHKTIIWSVKSAGTTGAAITGNTFNATAAGTAIITATIANGLAEGTPYVQDFTIKVTTITGTGELLASDLKIYPNPFTGAVRITGADVETLRAASLQIMDAAGLVVHIQTLAGNDETLNLEHLPDGVYFFRIEKDGKAVSVKMVKQ